MNIREILGTAAGAAVAPALAAVSVMRRARVLHPDGQTFRGVAGSLPTCESHRELRDRLVGPCLTRFSGALWRNGFEHFEVLGIAVRFRSSPVVTVVPDESDQDLLFATIVSPVTMGLAPLTTNAHDYLGNTYWAVSPFKVGTLKLKFRLTAVAGPHSETAKHLSRKDRLRRAVDNGSARFILEARETFTLAWAPLVALNVQADAELDEQALRFSPFRSGRGIEPSGFVHSMRRAAYAASQAARPDSSPSQQSKPQ